MNLSRLRTQIDQVDQKLLRLLNRRARLALKIGEIKRRQGSPVFDGKRESDIVKRLNRMNRGPFPSAAVRQIFRGIFRISRTLERSAGQ